jgi:hypothetical protein
MADTTHNLTLSTNPEDLVAQIADQGYAVLADKNISHFIVEQSGLIRPISEPYVIVFLLKTSEYMVLNLKVDYPITVPHMTYFSNKSTITKLIDECENMTMMSELTQLREIYPNYTSLKDKWSIEPLDYMYLVNSGILKEQ